MKTDNLECLHILEQSDLMEMRRDIIALSRFMSKVIALRGAQKDFFSEKKLSKPGKSKSIRNGG